MEQHFLKTTKKNTEKVYDFIGIGVGPFNLGLACLTAPIQELDGLFLDKREAFDWHPGMLLQDTTLQVPFLADMVTLAAPTSQFSFLNYLKEQGRIYSFYIRENFLVLRNEYNQYCQWVVSKLNNIRFSTEVREIIYDENAACYVLYCLCTKTTKLRVYRAKRLVFGTGTIPYVPKSCQKIMEHAVHSSAYLPHKKDIQRKKSITVIGSGQSAAEIYHDLLQDIDLCGYALNWITRSPRFYPMEYSKLTLEMTSPDYVDYFHSLPQQKRDVLAASQKSLYKGINNDLIGAIYDLMYMKSLVADVKVDLRTNSELVQAEYNTINQHFDLIFRQIEQAKTYKVTTEALIMATGYRYILPSFVDGISLRIKWDDKGRYDVSRNYSVDINSSEIFVQNAELHTHGFTAPDLGMGCYRNAYIIREMTGRDYYPIENRIAFQQFAIAEEEHVSTTADVI